MAVDEGKREIVKRNVQRLVLKNAGAAGLLGAAFQSAGRGSFERAVAARVFDFDPSSPQAMEELVAEALLNGLEEEDIEELFRRYARRKGLAF